MGAPRHVALPRGSETFPATAFPSWSLVHGAHPSAACGALFTQLSSHCGLVAPLWGLTQAVRAKPPAQSRRCRSRGRRGLTVRPAISPRPSAPGSRGPRPPSRPRGPRRRVPCPAANTASPVVGAAASPGPGSAVPDRPGLFVACRVSLRDDRPVSYVLRIPAVRPVSPPADRVFLFPVTLTPLSPTKGTSRPRRLLLPSPSRPVRPPPQTLASRGRPRAGGSASPGPTGSPNALPTSTGIAFLPSRVSTS